MKLFTIIRLFIVFLIAFSVTVLCISEYFLEFNISKRKKKALLTIIIIDILYITVFDRSSKNAGVTSLFPFKSYIDLFSGDWKNSAVFAWEQILGNVAIFVPFGMLVSELSNKNRLKLCVASGFLFSFAIELIQFITKTGKAEIDDIINNTLGVVFGFFLYISLKYLRDKDYKKALPYLKPMIYYGLFMLFCMIYCSRVNVFYG